MDFGEQGMFFMISWDDTTEMYLPEDEVVLTDPCICTCCWKQLSGYPPEHKCSNCGCKNPERESIERLKRAITLWCGIEDPAI